MGTYLVPLCHEKASRADGLRHFGIVKKIAHHKGAFRGGTDAFKISAGTFHLASRLKVVGTKYGVKVCANLDGSYNDASFFGIPGYLADYFTDPKYQARPGHYIWGSSYFIYEMLFHIDALLQGASEAEQRIIDRTLLDFSLGSTYFEHIDTVTGEPDKANQGWNAAVYAIWKQLVEEGAVSDRYLTEMENYLSAIE